jgi:hypothetical protein
MNLLCGDALCHQCPFDRGNDVEIIADEGASSWQSLVSRTVRRPD